MTLIGIRAFDITQDGPVWRVTDHDTGTHLHSPFPTLTAAEGWVPHMVFRCGARQEPAGCQTWTSHTTRCGAYRCHHHAAQHEAICTWRKK